MHLLLTGGTDGIGQAVLLELLQKHNDKNNNDLHITVVGRSLEKWNFTKTLLLAQSSSWENQVTFLQYDLSQMLQVRDLADKLKGTPLHGIIHCAGVMLKTKTLTSEGLETVFAVQYLARFYLNQLLAEHLQDSCTASQSFRPAVIVVSAGGTIASPSQLDFDNLQGEKFYNGVHALKHESIANDMQILQYHSQYPTTVKWYNYGPGYVLTNLMQDMPAVLRWFAQHLAAPFIGISPQRAAQDVVQLLLSSFEFPSGLYKRGLAATYICGQTIAAPSYLKFRIDPQNCSTLFQISDKLLKQVGDN